MASLTVDTRVPDYYSRIDRLLSLALWAGLASGLNLPFFFPIPYPKVYLYFALIALDAAVGLWAYHWIGQRWGMRKYYVPIVVNQLVSLGQLVLLGASGVYFFFPFILVQIISAVTLFRYRFVVLELFLTTATAVWVFGITDTFALGTPVRFMIGSMSVGSIALVSIFLFLAFRQITQMMLEVEDVKSSFIQDASHELRTPLTVIKAVNELLRDQRFESLPRSRKIAEDYGEVLGHLESATQDLEQITEKLNQSSKTRMRWPGLSLLGIIRQGEPESR